MTTLAGKVAVVIGGAGHLCSVLVKALIARGVYAYSLDMNPSQHGHHWTCDATSKSSLGSAYRLAMEQHGHIDILINGAGANAPTAFLEIQDDEIELILRTHLISVIYSCQLFGAQMVRQRSGSIINFASVASGPPLSKAFIYSAAKAGVVSITQNLAREWAPFNVRVNALRPGFFPTKWSMKNFITPKREQQIMAHTPMMRFGKPEELIGATLWLASDAASFVTGSIVSVDGGFTAMTI